MAIAHNAKAFDSQFIFKRAIFLKWNPQLILTGLKIISMKMQHIHFLASISYLPRPLRKLPEAFGLLAQKNVVSALLEYKGKFGICGPHTRR